MSKYAFPVPDDHVLNDVSSLILFQPHILVWRTPPVHGQQRGHRDRVVSTRPAAHEAAHVLLFSQQLRCRLTPALTRPRYPHRTDAVSDPADPGRGRASMHKAPPMTITVSAPWYVTGMHGTLCCATSYCTIKNGWRVQISGVVRQSECRPFPPIVSFRYLFVLHFIQLVCLWFRDVWFWKLLQSGPPRLNIWRPVSPSFIMSLVSPTRRCPENRNPAFSDWNNPNTTAFVIHAGCFRRRARVSNSRMSDIRRQNECVHAMPC